MHVYLVGALVHRIQYFVAVATSIEIAVEGVLKERYRDIGGALVRLAEEGMGR